MLRDLFKVFGHVCMIDTGSTDNTVEIAKQTAVDLNGELHLVVEDMGDDAIRIGNCPNRLRELVQTPWMFLVDGDEIWRESQLMGLVEGLPYAPADPRNVYMTSGLALEFHDGRIMQRLGDGMCADRIFGPGTYWNMRRDYPFQSHGLDQKFRNGLVRYSNFERSYYWHVRHLQRSSKDAETFYRETKRGYYPWSGPWVEVTPDWIGEINEGYPNPYLHS